MGSARYGKAGRDIPGISIILKERKQFWERVKRHRKIGSA
jgi:hypothetical protein